MAAVTCANMGKRLLHKLILTELFLAMLHGTFCFLSFDGYGWYVSATAALLYCSYFLHNIIAFIKNKPFFTRRLSQIYLGSLLLVLPYWILETYANFAFNNNINPLFSKTRYFEALFRDPWWIFTCCSLVYNIKKRYHFGLFELVRICPRFGVMLGAMALSIVFLILDVTFSIASFGGAVGVNPFWKFSLVFKCLCDTIILDDFRSALDRLRSRVFNQGTPLDHLSNPGASVSKRGISSNPNAHFAKSAQAKPVTLVYSSSKGEFEPKQDGIEKDDDGIYVSRTIAFEDTDKILDQAEGNWVYPIRITTAADEQVLKTKGTTQTTNEVSISSSPGSGPQSGW
ncbi:MAG: hypothetical protein M1832_000733 [Thelocarpon impressellum]|nr:MAG: hypothetical protein M1832_000733 [Thelocarpon impressellum]